MKSLKLRKIVASAVAALTIATLSPIGASAAWKQDSKGWWNTEGNSYSKGWRAINGSWYNFGQDGYMKTGWVKDGSTWYYLQPSGAMKTGWVNDEGTWYYLASSGAMKTGWVNDAGTWYYLAQSGAMKTGWINDNGTWYFAAASGAMQTGVVEVDGKIYYLAQSGAMGTGNIVINGVVYTFAASGEAIGDKKPTPSIIFTPGGVVVTPGKPSSTDTIGTISSGKSKHNGGGGGGTPDQTDDEKVQAALVNEFKTETIINQALVKSVPNTDGLTNTVTIPQLSFEPGKPSIETIEGKNYSITKNIYVSLDDGTDAGIQSDGSASAGYIVDKNKSGKITVVISALGEDGKLYYVTSENPATF